MRIAAQSVVVALRTLASPLVMCCSPHAIATHGTSALVNAITTNGTSRLFHCAPSKGRRMTRMISASANAPDADLMSTSTVGLMSCTPSLMKRNDAPQISAKAANAAYGSSGLFVSDTGRPLVGGEDEGDGAVVLDTHPHDCSKATRLGLDASLAKLAHECLVELLRARRVACFQETRTPAAAHVGEEGELRHDQRGAPHVDEAEVHLPRLVREHAEVDDLVRKSSHLVLVVIGCR